MKIRNHIPKGLPVALLAAFIAATSALHATTVENTFRVPMPDFQTPAQLAKWRADTTAKTVAKVAASRPSTVDASTFSLNSGVPTPLAPPQGSGAARSSQSNQLPPVAGFYTGKPYLAESGSYAFKYREYNPEMNRWTTVDPSGFPDGANNRLYAAVPTSEFDWEGLWTVSWSSSDYAGAGSTSASVAIDAMGTVTTVYDSNCGCYKAEVQNPFQFSLTGSQQLPEVGASFTGDGHTATIDATFRGTSITHENWHKTHDNDAGSKTYSALEGWSKNYVSNGFKTQAEAQAAGVADFTAAETLAATAFNNFYTRSGNHEGAGSGGTYYYYDSSVSTFRSFNPNWGGALDSTINSYSINFTKTAGNCE